MATDEILIDRDRVIELFLECVEERGSDYQHPAKQCVYFTWEGCPSCAVGWILNRVGLTAAMLEEMGPIQGSLSSATCDPNDAKWTVLWKNLEDIDELPLRFTPEAVKMIGGIQLEQDAGTPYGKILSLLTGGVLG